MRRQPTWLAEAIRRYRATKGGAVVEAALRRLESDAEVTAAFERMTVGKDGMFRIHPSLLLSAVMDAFFQAPLTTFGQANAARTECDTRKLLRSVDHLTTHYGGLIAGMRAILRTSETGRDVGSRDIERLSVLAGMREELARTLETVQHPALRLGNKRRRPSDTVGAFQFLLNANLTQDGVGSAYAFIGAVSTCLYPDSNQLQMESIRKNLQRARRRARDSKADAGQTSRCTHVPRNGRDTSRDPATVGVPPPQ